MNKINIPLEDTEDRFVIKSFENKRTLYVNDIYLTSEWKFLVKSTLHNEDLGMDVEEETQYDGVCNWSVDSFSSVSVSWNDTEGKFQLDIAFTAETYTILSSRKETLELAMEMILKWHRKYLNSKK